MDAEAYNEYVELSRGSADALSQDPETWWRWADESQKDEYNNIRQKARNFRTASSFFVGALVVNRIISTIDLRVFRKKSMTSGVRIETAVIPDLNGAVAAVNVNF
jgi:hypothetical protein